MIFIENPFESPVFLPILKIITTIFVIAVAILVPVSLRVKESLKQELISRTKSWGVIAILFFIAVFCGPLIAAIILIFIVSRALVELSTMASLPKKYRVALFSLIPISMAFIASGIPFSFLPILYFFTFVFIAIQSNRVEYFSHTITSLFGSFWLIFLLLHTQLLGMSHNGALLLCFTGTAAALADIGSYICGKILSQTKLRRKLPVASNLSENKTILGYIGGVIGVSLVTILYYPLLKTVAIPTYVFPLIIPVTSAFGDLTESLVKRYYVVKESGDFIPGHGGILDRLDSFIPSITVVYYLNLLFGA